MTVVLSRMAKGRPREIDLCAIVDESDRGWILERISREVCAHWSGRSDLCFVGFRFQYGTRYLPVANVYFFSHYTRLADFLQTHPASNAALAVWFTHPGSGVIDEEMREALEAAHRIFCSCSLHREALVGAGLPPEKLLTVLGGFDPEKFYAGNEDRREVIGICGRYYPRKNDALLLDLVSRRTEYTFEILGPRWERLMDRVEALGLTNVRSIEAPYEQYPDHMRRWRVFLSTSRLEGGPIALLEATACGAIPVVSDTGFARDFIEHGEHGFLFSVEAKADEVLPLLDQAMCREFKRPPSLVDYSWSAFARTICLSLESCVNR